MREAVCVCPAAAGLQRICSVEAVPVVECVCSEEREAEAEAEVQPMAKADSEADAWRRISHQLRFHARRPPVRHRCRGPCLGQRAVQGV